MHREINLIKKKDEKMNTENIINLNSLAENSNKEASKSNTNLVKITDISPKLSKAEKLTQNSHKIKEMDEEFLTTEKIKRSKLPSPSSSETDKNKFEYVSLDCYNPLKELINLKPIMNNANEKLESGEETANQVNTKEVDIKLDNTFEEKHFESKRSIVNDILDVVIHFQAEKIENYHTEQAETITSVVTLTENVRSEKIEAVQMSNENLHNVEIDNAKLVKDVQEEKIESNIEAAQHEEVLLKNSLPDVPNKAEVENASQSMVQKSLEKKGEVKLLENFLKPDKSPSKTSSDEQLPALEAEDDPENKQNKDVENIEKEKFSDGGEKLDSVNKCEDFQSEVTSIGNNGK